MIDNLLIPYFDNLNNNSFIKIHPFSEFKELAKHVIFDPHRIDYYGFVFLTNGNASHHIFETEVRLRRGDILLVNPGNIHHFGKSEEVEGWVLAFSEDILYCSIRSTIMAENCKIINNLCNLWKLSCNEDQLIEFDRLMNMIYLVTRNNLDKSRDIILKHLFSAMLQFMKYFKGYNNLLINLPLNSDYKLSVSFRNLVFINSHKSRDLDFYLDKMSVSKSKLYSAVKSAFFMTPKEIIDRELIKESKRQISDPLKQIKEIAYNLGFEVPSNFTKFFRRRTGLTPEEFRQAVRF